MKVSINELAEELRTDVSWQRTPEVITDAQYEALIIRGIKRMMIDTSRASQYNDDLLVYDENSNSLIFDIELLIDEIAYILICSKILFFQRVQADVNNIVGYTTDALTVTSADKPYAHLQDTIDKLENERRIIYYKMPRYTLEYTISD